MPKIQFSPNPFPNEECARIAKDLVEYVSDNEQELNWDECIFALGRELQERKDSSSRFPEGCYFLARFEKAVSKNFEDKNFKILLQDKDLPDDTRNITIPNFYTEFDGQAVAYAFVEMVEQKIKFEHWHKAVNAIAKALTEILARRYRRHSGNFLNIELQGHVRNRIFSGRYVVIAQ